MPDWHDGQQNYLAVFVAIQPAQVPKDATSVLKVEGPHRGGEAAELCPMADQRKFSQTDDQ